MPLLQAEESEFIDSPHKVYVGNLAKTVTTDTLKNFFSEKGKVLSAKVSRVPGTSKSSGYGFVTFPSEEDVEAAISSFNNSVSCLLLLFICKLRHPNIPQIEGTLNKTPRGLISMLDPQLEKNASEERIWRALGHLCPSWDPLVENLTVARLA